MAQTASASGFGRVFQAGGDMVVYEGRAPYRISVWPPAPAVPSPERLRRQPSLVLRAAHEVVGFTGRGAEVDRLRAWRDDPSSSGVAVRLVHGAGGQGKTRLAGHLAGAWARQGWVVLAAHHRRDRSVPPVLRVPEPDGAAGVLVVVDYAERWDTADLLTLLADTAIGAGVPVRVLLLSRPAGTWWQSVAGRIGRELDVAATRQELGPLEGDPGVTRAGLFASARDRFAEALGVPGDAGVPGGLERHAAYGLVLTVHMAALAAVLARPGGAGAPVDPVEVSAFLLARERDHWEAMHAPTRDNPVATSPEAMGQAVYAATLTGPLTHADGRAVLLRAGVESHLDVGQILKDHALYYPPGPDPSDANASGADPSDPDRSGANSSGADPSGPDTPSSSGTSFTSGLPETPGAPGVPGPPGGEARMLQPLYPDRLGEDFIALTTPGHPHDHPADPWAHRAPSRLLTPATEPTGSSATGSSVTGSSVTGSSVTGSSVTGSSVTGSSVTGSPVTGSPVTGPYGEADPGGGVPGWARGALGVLVEVAARWPHVAEYELYPLLRAHPRLALTAGGTALTTLAGLDTIDPALLEAIEAELPAHRHIDLDIGIAALATRLAAHRLAATGDLARHGRVHDDLALRQSYAGLHTQALASNERALRIWAELVRHDRAAYLPELAMSLHNHALGLATMGRRAEAVTMSKEALDLYEELADADRATYLPGLAASLNTHANRLAAVGRQAEAAPVSRRALESYEEMTGPDRTGRLPDLAMALHNHAALLAELGRRAEAVPVSRQALDLYEELAGADRAAYLPGLAMALNNHAALLAGADRRAEAVAVSRRAVGAHRELAGLNRDAHLPGLAMALNNHGKRLAEAGWGPEAVAVSRETLALYEELAGRNRDAHLPGLAKALNNQAAWLAEVERWDEAVAVSRRAVALRHDLAETDRGAHLPDLAVSLNNHAALLAGAGRRDEALAVSRQAVASYEELAESDRGAHLSGLAMALTNHALRVAEEGRDAEAVAMSERAVGLYEELAESDPDAHLPGFATSLNNHANRLAGAGREGEAVAVAERGVELYADLAERDRDAHLPEYVRSLAILGRVLVREGRFGAATGLLAAALQLAQELPGHAQGIAGAITDLLRSAYAAGPEQVTERLREITGADVPDWMRRPPAE
ncbi:tetratricopeptide repeat protein [Sphaerisporangium corydalis]|uniref:tetratricopeptide repeat protein n=1 Tax=Sphaerisporangium corydalis TaxID=1441875 RepID=UPI0036D2593D